MQLCQRFSLPFYYQHYNVKKYGSTRPNTSILKSKSTHFHIRGIFCFTIRFPTKRSRMKSYIAFIAALIYLPTAQSVCTEPRIRKSWDVLRAEGGTALYIEAVQHAVRLGYQQDFANAHFSKNFDDDEAHSKGSFLFWHRRYLLAYENMLRSLGPQYECVTVPYWNYFHESNLLLESSSSTGLLDVSNICNELPLGIALRSNWESFRTFPEIGLASTVWSLDVDHFEFLSSNIENGVHMSIHNWLGSTMSSYSAPLDPIFFSHHATIDLLHTIYYECKAGLGQSDEFKRTSTIAYHPWGGAPSSESAFNMGQISSLIAPFFQELPDQYYEFVDHTNIGEFGYNYQRDSNFNAEISRMNCIAQSAPTNSRNLADASNADSNMESFYDQVLAGCISSDESCKGQAVVAECLCFDELFGVEDYSAEFRQNFNVSDDKHTECFKSILDYEKAQAHNNVSNLITIEEAVWQGACHTHFGQHEEEKTSAGDSVFPTTYLIITLYMIKLLSR